MEDNTFDTDFKKIFLLLHVILLGKKMEGKNNSVRGFAVLSFLTTGLLDTCYFSSVVVYLAGVLITRMFLSSYYFPSVNSKRFELKK